MVSSIGLALGNTQSEILGGMIPGLDSRLRVSWIPVETPLPFCRMSGHRALSSPPGLMQSRNKNAGEKAPAWSAAILRVENDQSRVNAPKSPLLACARESSISVRSPMTITSKISRSNGACRSLGLPGRSAVESGIAWGEAEWLPSSIQDQTDLPGNLSPGRWIKAFISQFPKPPVQSLLILGLHRGLSDPGSTKHED